MMAFDDALNTVLALAPTPAVERVELDAAFDRVLASPVTARSASPATAVSAMDGYAVRDSDLAQPGAALPVVGESKAGAATPGALAPGSCMRVFTGAATPFGADRVIVQEEVRRDGALAVFDHALSPRRHIRPAGSDFAAGEVLLRPGVALDPARLVALAAADRGTVEVFSRPRVFLIATGDEIRAPGAGSGGVPDSVSLGVAALVRRWGGDVVGRLRLADDLSALETAAARALAEADIVVVCGGASVGEYDLGRSMFAPMGLDMAVDKVALKPGKPVWFGRCGGRAVVGLPGNPASAMVTGRLLLAPLIAAAAGLEAGAACRWDRAMLEGDLPAGGERETFVRVERSVGGIRPLANQDSSSQATLGRTDGLVRLRPGDPPRLAGETVLWLAFNPT